MTNLKITIIGGGSSYTPELVEGLIVRNDSLPITEIYLLDIDQSMDRLKIIYDLTLRMIHKAGLNIRVNMGTNRYEALRNSNFVITQVRVGLLESRIMDEKTALSHGFLGQETNGAVGLLKALRTIPVILDIAEDIHRICPHAWLINFTNPVSMVLEALERYSSHKKFIGLCNVPVNIKNSMADLLKIDRKRLSMDFVGLNHFVYATRIYKDKIDLTPQAIESFMESSKDITMKNIDAPTWDRDFIKALNMIPCPYHLYYYKRDFMLQEELRTFAQGETRGTQVKEIENKLFEIYKDVSLDHKPEELEKRGGAYYSDVACQLMDSLYNDRGDEQVVNTTNRGAIPEFPDNHIVETNCIITKDGPIPKKNLVTPYSILGQLYQMKHLEIMTVQAAVTGDWNLARLAFTSNPLCGDDERGAHLIDEMISNNKKHLPLFFKEDAN